MALFNFGKKNQEEKRPPACTCGCNCSAAEAESTESCCCAESTVTSIKVLGSGCKSCHALLESTKEAVSALGLKAQVEFVSDMQQIMNYGVMSMPALVINEKVVSMGKVLKAADVAKLLGKPC